MIKICKINEEKLHNIVCFGDMAPYDIGKVVTTDSSYFGKIVMRTASTMQFEVMDLSEPQTNGCWTHRATQNDLLVELFPPGSKITIEVQ